MNGKRAIQGSESAMRLWMKAENLPHNTKAQKAFRLEKMNLYGPHFHRLQHGSPAPVMRQIIKPHTGSLAWEFTRNVRNASHL